MLQEWADQSFLEACGNSFLGWCELWFRWGCCFVCLLLQRARCSWDRLFHSSEAPSGEPGSRRAFGYLCPVIKDRALGEKMEHSRCSDQECTQHCSFLTSCVTLLGTLPCFSATGCCDTNFSVCIVASHDQKPCKRGAIWDNSCTSFPPHLPSSSDSNLCLHTTSWPHLPHSEVIHKVNTRRHSLSKEFFPSSLQKGPSASLRAGVASIQPPHLSANFALSAVVLVTGEETWF